MRRASGPIRHVLADPNPLFPLLFGKLFFPADMLEFRGRFAAGFQMLAVNPAVIEEQRKNSGITAGLPPWNSDRAAGNSGEQRTCSAVACF